MSSLNSSSSFSEDDLFFTHVPEACLKPTLVLKNLKVDMDKNINVFKSSIEATAIKEMSIIQSCEKKISELSEEIERVKIKKYEIASAIMEAKQLLQELSVKKKLLEEKNFDVVTREEISEMLEQVVSLEKENEIKQEEMKKTKIALVGQMCFYKEYLDTYIALAGNNDYILYFRRTKGQEEVKPKEWIRVKTDTFKEYQIIDTSLPEGTAERTKLMDLFNTGVPLRQLIYQARKLCLGKNQ